MLTQNALRKEPGITQFAFARLLEWLDDGVESDGERYLEIRGRLVTYFDRRNRPFAEELADETLNRVARTLEKSGVIAVTPPARYCYVVARFVLLEDIRRTRRQIPVDESHLFVKPPTDAAASALREDRLRRLDVCLARLKPEQRDIVVEYYRDVRRDRIDRRRRLAARLGISMNALSIRAWRTRQRLERCLSGLTEMREPPAKDFECGTPTMSGR